MRKIIALLLLLLCLSLALVSCGGEDNEENEGSGGSGGSEEMNSLQLMNSLMDYYKAPWGKTNIIDCTIKIDTNPYDVDSDNSSSTTYASRAMDSIESINNELGFPSYVYDDMLATRALDGRQTYSGAKGKIEIEVSWRYHPDTGLEVTYIFD